MQSPQHDTAVLGIMYTMAYLGFQLGGVAVNFH